jgi:outer membrane receptor for ferrienterochelin and colicins
MGVICGKKVTPRGRPTRGGRKMKVLQIVFILMLTLALATTAGPAHSQQGPEAADDLEMTLFEDIPSVYSASKYEQKVTEAPAFVSIVTADEIQKYGYRTLAEALRSLPGFYLTYDRSYIYLGDRGFSRPGDYNTRFLLLVDGVRLNDSVYDSGSVGTEFPLDVDLIDRVEVVRGPASSLYGSNALFGVINVITKRGRDLQGFEVSGEVGSLETYKARLSYGQRFSQGLELIVSGTWYESRGDDSLYFPEYDDPSTNDGIFEDNDDTQSFQLFGRASWGDFELEGAYGSAEKGTPTGAYDAVFNDPRSQNEDTEYFLSLLYRHLFTGDWDVLGRAYYASYPYKGDYAYDYAEEEDEEPYLVVNKDDVDARWWGVETQVSKRFFDSHRVTTGLEFRDNARQNQKNYDEEIYIDSEESSLFWGIFIQDEWQITDGLILNAGLRYDDFENYDGNWSPRAALIYSPAKGSTLKFLYGQAFRTPNAYEQFYGDEVFQKAASDLDTESIKTFEAVWEQQLGGNIRSTVAAFYYRMDDLIDLTVDPEDEMLVFENIEEAEAKGVELQLEGKWANGIEGRVSYTWQDAEDRKTGEDLFNSPRHLAKVNAIFPIIREKLFAGAELLYTSERLTLNGDNTDDSFLTNLTFFNQTIPNRLKISAGVYNLFDEDIAHPASEELLQNVVLQDGRTVRLKVTVSF